MKFRYVRHVYNTYKKYFSTRTTADKKQTKFLLGMFDNNKTLVKRFEEHIPILDKMFPDNWDIVPLTYKIRYRSGSRQTGRVNLDEVYHSKVHKMYVSEFRLIVRFPEVTVVSEDEGEVDIQDLFMSWRIFDINLVDSTWRFDYLRGIRTTVPFDHYVAGYMHSHLSTVSTGSLPNWDGFCLSSSGTALTNEVLRSKPMRYTMAEFQMHLLNCKMLAKTQYCSGSPPSRMKNIASNSYQEVNINRFSTRETRREIDRIFRNITDWSTLPLVLENGQILLTGTTELNQLCIQIVRNSAVVKHYNGRYYTLASSSSSSSIDRLRKELHGTTLFMFNGKPVKYTILNNQGSAEIENSPSAVHPYIIENVKKEIQARATRNYHCSYITHHGIESSSESGYDRPMLSDGYESM